VTNIMSVKVRSNNLHILVYKTDHFREKDDLSTTVIILILFNMTLNILIASLILLLIPNLLFRLNELLVILSLYYATYFV
jgi:hypothetical protein